MHTTIHFVADDGQLHDEMSEAEALEHFRAEDGLLWIDIEAADEDARPLLQDRLGFHRVSVDNCLDTRIDPPKVTRYADHLFVLAHGVDHTAESDVVEVTEMGLFLGTRFVVTCHSDPLYSLESVRREFLEEPDSLPRQGADFLAYALVERLVANTAPTIDSMRAVADQIEDEIISTPKRVHLDAMIRLKRSALRLERFLGPEQVALSRIVERGGDLVGQDARFYFEDAAGEAQFLAGLAASTRERAESAASTYLSVVGIRQNDAVRELTMLAFVFLPLTLLVGIYGMNFEYMPELEWRYAHFVVLGVIVSALVSVALWITLARLAIGREARRFARAFVVEPRRVAGYAEAVARWPRVNPRR